jgi:hypothetical protein
MIDNITTKENAHRVQSEKWGSDRGFFTGEI